VENEIILQREREREREREKEREKKNLLTFRKFITAGGISLAQVNILDSYVSLSNINI